MWHFCDIRNFNSAYFTLSFITQKDPWTIVNTRFFNDSRVFDFYAFLILLIIFSIFSMLRKPLILLALCHFSISQNQAFVTYAWHSPLKRKQHHIAVMSLTLHVRYWIGGVLSLPILYTIFHASAKLFFDEGDRHPLSEQFAIDHVGIIEV